jgi:microcystin-dependent protein
MKSLLLVTALAASSLVLSAPASAQTFYLGEVRLFGSNYCPTGWVAAQGQTMHISQNTALFSLLGTAYGGDGTTTFKLPDLQGKAPIGAGSAALPPGSTLGREEKPQPAPNQFLAMTWCIAVTGAWPQHP